MAKKSDALQVNSRLDMTPAQHKSFIGHNLMIARESIGMKPSVFSRRLGISQQQLWNWETGLNYPDPQVLSLACSEFGFSMDWFYRGIRAGVSQDIASRLQQTERELQE